MFEHIEHITDKRCWRIWKMLRVKYIKSRKKKSGSSRKTKDYRGAILVHRCHIHKAIENVKTDYYF